MNYIRYTDERGLFASTEAIGTDATTIENLANFGSINIGQDWIKDWKKIRSEIKSIAITRTGNPDIPTWTTEQWNMFTESEKVILCNFMPNKIPIAYMIAMQTAGLIVIADCGVYFDTQSKIARRSRWEACRVVVMGSFDIQATMETIQWGVLSFANADWVNGVDLSIAYINGYEQQSEDFRYGLIDYVNNELANSGLVPVNGMTLAQIVAYLNDILINGNY